MLNSPRSILFDFPPEKGLVLAKIGTFSVLIGCSILLFAPPTFGSPDPRVWRPRNGACEILFSTQSPEQRIFSVFSYPLFSHERDLAIARQKERTVAEQAIDPVFDHMQIRLDQAQASIRLGRAELESLEKHTEDKTVSLSSPLRAGINRALQFLQNKSFVSKLSDDALIIFLSRSYELQRGIMSRGTLNWNTDQDPHLKTTDLMETSDLLTELKSEIWRELFRRKRSADSVQTRVAAFYDLNIGGIGIFPERDREDILTLIKTDRMAMP